ncbi:hypothetical protein EFR01_11450 [Sinorhizobium fredii]|nr:hypothetical protein EFR01_11450 [Sinorhizobium fredii]GLS11433.1 hypothetical protein GCM10007864_50640 [Sinorhizobium fredii]
MPERVDAILTIFAPQNGFAMGLKVFVRSTAEWLAGREDRGAGGRPRPLIDQAGPIIVSGRTIASNSSFVT